MDVCALYNLNHPQSLSARAEFIGELENTNFFHIYAVLIVKMKVFFGMFFYSAPLEYVDPVWKLLDVCDQKIFFL